MAKTCRSYCPDQMFLPPRGYSVTGYSIANSRIRWTGISRGIKELSSLSPVYQFSSLASARSQSRLERSFGFHSRHQRQAVPFLQRASVAGRNNQRTRNRRVESNLEPLGSDAARTREVLHLTRLWYEGANSSKAMFGQQTANLCKPL